MIDSEGEVAFTIGVSMHTPHGTVLPWRRDEWVFRFIIVDGIA